MGLQSAAGQRGLGHSLALSVTQLSQVTFFLCPVGGTSGPLPLGRIGLGAGRSAVERPDSPHRNSREQHVCLPAPGGVDFSCSTLPVAREGSSPAPLRSLLDTAPFNTTPGHRPSRGAQLPGPSTGSAPLGPRSRAKLLPVLSAALSSTAPSAAPQRFCETPREQGGALSWSVTQPGGWAGPRAPGHSRGRLPRPHCPPAVPASLLQGVAGVTNTAGGIRGVTSKQSAVWQESVEEKYPSGNRWNREWKKGADQQNQKTAFKKVNRTVQPLAGLTKKKGEETQIT